MLKLQKIITSFLMVITLTTSIIGNAANNADGAKLKTKGEQNQLADIQPDGRKKLKQKIKLEYTHPDFEKMLDNSQKEAIIKSLKKWKLDLPVNNTFTVTSIGNFKDPNNKVVYMWASTPNQDWDKSKTPSGEDFETGDPRFVRAEFNVLLNKAPKKAWKATIEQDNELKTELNNIAESEISTGEKNIMFGNNLAENKFTEKSEILIDSTIATTANSTSSQSTEPKKDEVTDKKVGLLDFLFSSPIVSAGPNDYSWPWANGGIRSVSQGWHGSQTVPGPDGNIGSWDGWDGQESLDSKNIALDVVMPNGSIAGTDVLSPISGTTSRKCNDTYNSTVLIGRMRILHMSSDSNFGKYQPDTTYTKGQKIGIVASNITSINNPSNLSCGAGTAPHLHIKLLDNNMNVDGKVMNYATVYNGQNLTSQNSTTVTPPPTPTSSKFNIRRTGTNQCINSYLPANNKALDTWLCDTTDPEETWEQVPLTGGFSLKRKNTNFCIDAANPQTDGQVKVYTCNNTDSQKFQYDSGSKKFYRVGTSNNNQCVAKGSPSNGALIKMYTCTAFNDNFKWDFVPV